MWKTWIRKLWDDEGGAILSAELVLIVAIVLTGLVVGLSGLRDAVVTELGDTGGFVASLNQSFSYSGVAGHHAFSLGSMYTDRLDSCDDQCAQPVGANPRCMLICSVQAAHEGIN